MAEQKTVEKKEEPKKEEKPIIEEEFITEKEVKEISMLIRAAKGLPLEEDLFSGLLNVKDIRERTRISSPELYAHSYMRLLKNVGGDEWQIMEDVANMEDHYYISLDGEQRKEAILMTKAKTELQVAQPLAIQMPETKPLEKPKEEKKGIFHR